MRQSLIAVVACIALSVACDNSDSSSTTTPTAPPAITDTFMGTIDPGGSSSHNFVVTQQGEVDVTLTAAGPPATIFMGVGLGATSSDPASPCSLDSRFTVQAQAGTTPQVPPAIAPPGTFCVKVFDLGNQAAQVAYTVTVAHP